MKLGIPQLKFNTPPTPPPPYYTEKSKRSDAQIGCCVALLFCEETIEAAVAPELDHHLLFGLIAVMDENRDELLRFICKFCFRRYPCGKSLGGHIRSHFQSDSDEIAGFGESSHQSAYGLRENPRKTWRSVEADDFKHRRICRTSTKALCRHIPYCIHPQRDQIPKAAAAAAAADDDDDDDEDENEDDEDEPWTSHSDSEVDPVIRTRSSSKTNKSGSLNHGSSSVSEIVGDEKEEVAMCLMLLSRDTVVDSSDNNRTESSAAQMENSDSEYFLDESESMISSINGHPHRSKSSNAGGGKYECFDCSKIFASYQALGGHKPCHKRNLDRYESGENSPEESSPVEENKKRKQQPPLSTSSAIKGKNNGGGGKSHVCPFCDRVFKNGQALGGHKRSHFIGGNHNNSNGNGSGSSRNNKMKMKMMKKKNKKDSSELIDLNLPPEDDDHRNHPFFSASFN